MLLWDDHAVDHVDNTVVRDDVGWRNFGVVNNIIGVR